MSNVVLIGQLRACTQPTLQSTMLVTSITASAPFRDDNHTQHSHIVVACLAVLRSGGGKQAWPASQAHHH